MGIVQQIREEFKPLLKEREERGIEIGVKRGELNGRKETLLSMLETFAPELSSKYKRSIEAVSSLEEFVSLRDKIFKQMGSLR